MIRILIVEDEKDMREIYKDMFSDEKERYEIGIESDAAVALKKLKERTFDLIILDIIMEPMTGDSFFIYVRSDERTKNLPVLVVSVLVPEMSDSLKKVDHVHFLQKPITKEKLLEEIDRILS